jgi:ATP-dependent DNA helicase DinG
MSLLDFFPNEFKPMSQQVELLTKIDEAFNEGYRFVVCCAPTGSGKSFLSKTLSNYSKDASENFKNLIETNNAFKVDNVGEYLRKDDCLDEKPFGVFALTITKSLQDQYTNLFKDSCSLKGKSNYLCNIDPKYDVEIAPCLFNQRLKETCILNSTCAYYNARKAMLTNKFGVLNYSMFLSLPEHVKHREYIICDEASEVEDELVKRFSRSIPYKFLKRLGYSPNDIPITNYSKFKIWLDNLVMVLGDEVNSLKQSMNKNRGKSSDFDSDALKFKLYSNMYSQLKTTVDTWKNCEYILENNLDGIYLKPLRVDNLAKEIFDFGDKILLMSATIIDHKNFTKTLGIKEYKYIEVDSTFDPHKAPIYATKGNKINYKNLKEKLPSLKKVILELCKKHEGEKGIIHTHTNEITQYLKDNIDDEERYLFRLDGSDNEQILKRHIESKHSTILVSPSMSYGVDLKGDLAKFQIIVKASFMPLNDERIKRLFNEDKDWYVNKMLNNLIQACGRGVRSKNDTCVTYILDGNITDSVIRNSSKLPRYFLDRFV